MTFVLTIFMTYFLCHFWWYCILLMFFIAGFLSGLSANIGSQHLIEGFTGKVYIKQNIFPISSTLNCRVVHWNCNNYKSSPDRRLLWLKYNTAFMQLRMMLTECQRRGLRCPKIANNRRESLDFGWQHNLFFGTLLSLNLTFSRIAKLSPLFNPSVLLSGM